MVSRMLQVLDMLSADDPDDMTHLEAVLRELEWVNFPGVQCLLIKVCTFVTSCRVLYVDVIYVKGLTSSATSETTIHLLARLTPIANHHVFTAYPFLGNMHVFLIYFNICLSSFFILLSRISNQRYVFASSLGISLCKSRPFLQSSSGNNRTRNPFCLV